MTGDPGEWALDELRQKDAVLASLEHMLECQRHGLCLLAEWMRRYGQPGSGCRCFWRFSETHSGSQRGRDQDDDRWSKDEE